MMAFHVLETKAKVFYPCKSRNDFFNLDLIISQNEKDRKISKKQSKMRVEFL